MTKVRALFLAAAVSILNACATERQVIETGYEPPHPGSLSAQLLLPAGAGPHPVVIVAHGCGGITAAHVNWASKVTSWGYATLLLDSLGPRSLSSICADVSPLPAANRAEDIGAAARWLRKRPEIDPARIGLLGFSHGGATALWAARDNWPARTGVPPINVVIAYYPYCNPRTDALARGPLLVLIGEDDDWTLPERCRQSQVAMVQQSDVEFVYYPGARHGVDTPGLNRVIQGVETGNLASRWLLYDPKAANDAEARTRQWLDRFLRKPS